MRTPMPLICNALFSSISTFATPPFHLCSSSCFYHLRLYHLRQRGFSLRQPEGHVHGAVERHGRGQGSTGLLPPADLGIQYAKAEVAVSHEGAHAPWLGES